MQEIMIAIVLGIAVGCSDLLNYNVKNGSAGFLQSVCLSCCCVWVLRSAVMQSFWANWTSWAANLWSWQFLSLAAAC